MKRIVKMIATALVVAMLLAVAVGPVRADCPVGTEAEWEGSVDNLYTTDENWVNENNPPGGTTDFVCLPYEDVGDNICEYDGWYGSTPWWFTIFGQSPTFFAFNITNDICPAVFDLQDYASLDVDECVEAGATDLSGRVKIDVAFGEDCCLGNGDVEDESAELDLTGQVKFETLTISADNGSQSIRMIVDSGGTVLADETRIKAEVDVFQTAYNAQLHLKDGLITTNDLRLWGGQANDRRVSLDLDKSMTVRNKTTLGVFPGAPTEEGGGRVAIDLPIGVTLDLGELHIAGPCVLKVTGIGISGVDGQVVTSANEGASANTCTCLCS